MSDQWLRKAQLIVANDNPTPLNTEPGLDLSTLHFKFSITAADEQSPNAAVIRVYNLAEDTVATVLKEFNRVILNAGYENGSFGVIFDGLIKQFRRGKENATDTYLDILAADGDLGYNFGIVNSTTRAGSTPRQRIDEVCKEMGIPLGYAPDALDATGGILPRGKVRFGMARAQLRTEARTLGSTWSIQNGRVNVVPLRSYLDNGQEAVVLTSKTGMVGIPEQTDQGILVRCLLNPRIIIGGLIKIDNASINKMQQNSIVPFDQWTGIQLPAKTANDGYYRVFVVEHTGDTRGMEWYSDVTCLAFDKSSGTCKAVN